MNDETPRDTGFNEYQVPGGTDSIYTVDAKIQGPPIINPENITGNDNHFIDASTIVDAILSIEQASQVGIGKSLQFKIGDSQYTMVFYKGNNVWSEDPSVLGKDSTLVGFVNGGRYPIKDVIPGVNEQVDAILLQADVDIMKDHPAPVYR